MGHPRGLLPLLIAAALSSWSCGGAHLGDDTVRVEVSAFQYRPDPLTVKAGATVIWTNGDNIDHTVTSGRQRGESVPGVTEGAEAKPDGVFRGALPDKGSAFEFTFSEPGGYRYYCEIHAGMSGNVVVE